MASLLELIGLDAAECAQRMQLLGFGEEDRRRLADLADFLESIADEMAEGFYEQILAQPATARFLQDAELVKRLKSAQRRHFLELCRGPYDAAYFESRLRVGLAHSRIHLDPHLYLSGYEIQVRFVRHALGRHFRDDPERAVEALDSFQKVIMLDISLATEAYIYGGFVERSTADLRAYEARLAQEALESRIREEEKREELLRMVVHDIRSPVAAIMATARAALRRYPSVSESPGKQFALVEATGQNVLHIIDDIVSHARAPGGELPFSPEAFDVAELVASCAAQLQPFARQTGHVLETGTLAATPSSSFDKILLRRIVSNLLMNACRHTAAGTSIRVSVESDDALCRILVADDGAGLPQPIREALLSGEPLPPRAGAGAYHDSGLGLPFCLLACERMGGTIELADAELPGTRFLVKLPRQGISARPQSK